MKNIFKKLNKNCIVLTNNQELVQEIKNYKNNH